VLPGPVYLLDANAIIEAVRTGTWAAISGGLHIETVSECAQECRRGDEFSTGYVVVSEPDLGRLKAIHTPTGAEVAAVLSRPKSEALDVGERDLMAHAIGRATPPAWLVCSPDKASVKFAVGAGLGDRLMALEEMVVKVGARPMPGLRAHFSAKWLSTQRTDAILEAI